jgi:hypothetical protein
VFSGGRERTGSSRCPFTLNAWHLLYSAFKVNGWHLIRAEEKTLCLSSAFSAFFLEKGGTQLGTQLESPVGNPVGELVSSCPERAISGRHRRNIEGNAEIIDPTWVRRERCLA